MHLAMQESASKRRLLHDACWGKQIGITKFVFVVAEVLNFDPAFVDQGFEAVIQTANAYAQFFSQLTLRDVRAFVQDVHHPEVGVFLLVGLATGHGSDGCSRQATAVPSCFSGTQKSLLRGGKAEFVRS